MKILSICTTCQTLRNERADKKGQRVGKVDGLPEKDVLESNAKGPVKRNFTLNGKGNNLQR